MSANESQFWDKMARKYAASPIADEAGYERSLDQVRRYLGPKVSVFEFGCGTGTTALKLAPNAARIVATDISPEMIAIAREKAAAQGCANVKFDTGTPDAAPYPDASFDVALGFNILHLVQARAAALAGVRRLLKPGGVFISKTPCLGEMNFMLRLAVPLMQAVGKAPYVAFFSAEQVEREIASAGFEIVERARHGSKRKDPRIFLVARRV